jgi:hypothetical protein
MVKEKSQTRYAKQLFLYGAGDGVPVRNVAKLSELSKVTDETIRKHLPGWEREAEQLLANTSEVGLAIKLSKETLDANNRDIEFIRDQMNQCAFEIKNMDKIVARLAEWLDKFDEDNIKDALSIFNDWQRAFASKSSLRSQFIALKKLWDEKSGIDGFREVGLVREKTISTGKAKLELKKLESEEAKGSVRHITTTGVFARPVRELTVRDSSSGEDDSE